MPPDPDSLVDFLKARKQSSDFRSRQILWGLLDPREVYSGSATQNTRLLEALSFGEQAPELVFENALVIQGDAVTARIISPTPVVVESGLNRRSILADPDDVVDLGLADAFGIFPMHVKNDQVSSLGQLTLLPEGDRVSVQWWNVPTEIPEDSIFIELPDPSFETIVEQFFSHFPNVAGEAAEQAFEDLFSINNLTGLVFDSFSGMAILLIPGAGAGVYVAGLAVDYGFEFLAKFLEHAINLAPEPSDPADKAALRGLLLGPLSAIRVGLSIRRIRDPKLDGRLKEMRQLCNVLTETNTLGGWTVSRFTSGAEESPMEIAGAAFRSTINPMISIVCKAIVK